jgi:hypothetical protein
MKIFPLSIPGKIVLILIAIMLGLIFWMMSKPEHWSWLFKRLRAHNKDKDLKVVKKNDFKKE